jgi:signal transduction histidine kinase
MLFCIKTLIRNQNPDSDRLDSRSRCWIGVLMSVIKTFLIRNIDPPHPAREQVLSKISLKKAPMSLRSVAEQVIDIVGSRVAAGRVDFAILFGAELMASLSATGDDEGMAGLSQWVIGDEFRLRQVLVNFCDIPKP